MKSAPWLVGALFCVAEAAAQPWAAERAAPRSEPPERSERDNEPWFQRGTSSTEPAAPERRPSPSTPLPKEARDPDLARCDRYQAQLEVLLREEMRGRSTGAQQRSLHEQRLRDGC